MTLNYKLIATQFGESIKFDTTLKEVNRIFLSLTDLTFNEYPVHAISSSRSQTIYSWVMTIGNSKLKSSQKIDLIKQAIELLVLNEGNKFRLLGMLPRQSVVMSKAVIKRNGRNYVSKIRIKSLKRLKSAKFDFLRLIKFCEELNLDFDEKSYLSVITLVRAILDHVPPVFGFDEFTKVANNYGTKSFKESMLNLNNSSRKISDAYLHTQIRKNESLPTLTQVDFSNDLDVLLSEIVRIS